MTLRVLAVDDEPFALRRVQLLLDRVPNVALVGTARSGREAIDRIAATRPDVLLLDVTMAGMGGFDVIDALAGPSVPLVIFVTAFDHFAVRAFEVQAVDYIVKPLELDRLRAALERARISLEAADATMRVAELREVVAALRSQSRPEPTRYETEVWAERRREFIRVSVSDIDWIEAERDHVRLHVGDASYLMRETMSGIEKRLDPQKFVRVRRSAVVQLDRIAAIRKGSHFDYRVRLSNGSHVRVGRTYIKAVRGMLYSRMQDGGDAAEETGC